MWYRTNNGASGVHSSFGAVPLTSNVSRDRIPMTAKAALIFYLPMPTSSAVCWRWRSVDGAAESSRSFVYYSDCAEDARLNGYTLHTPQPHARAMPTDQHEGEQHQQYVGLLGAKPGRARH